jgi:hypothetical protein
LAALTAALLGAACVSLDTVRNAVVTRAAGELSCDQTQLAIVHVEGDESIAGFEVAGCGRRRSYAGRCWVSQLDVNCHVVAASGLSLTAPAPVIPAPPPAPWPYAPAPDPPPAPAPTP